MFEDLLLSILIETAISLTPVPAPSTPAQEETIYVTATQPDTPAASTPESISGD